jgi:hypothetical protein
MVYNITGQMDEENSFVRYIYQDVRDELKNVWKAMLTVLGMLGVAISYVLKGTDKLPSLLMQQTNKVPSQLLKEAARVDSLLEYIIVSQFIWLFAMIEILLVSNYISKHKFLIEVESKLDPSLKTRENKTPFWQSWIRTDSPSGLSGYTIPVLSILGWSILAFLGAACIGLVMSKIADEYKFILSIVLGLELVVAILASGITFKEYYLTKSGSKFSDHVQSSAGGGGVDEKAQHTR